jgi:hypothetical protein
MSFNQKLELAIITDSLAALNTLEFRLTGFDNVVFSMLIA